MSLRYRCLVLDHDDTVVDSTATIHHPCFQAFLDEVRPGARIELETYLLENFTGSFPALCRDRYGLTEAEMARELQFWDAYVAAHVPRAYSGMAAFLARYRAAGGKLCVVSHSLSGNIRRDYRENGLPEPDLIFGWDAPPEQRKPNAYPLREIMRQLALPPSALLMVDDLRHGYTMAKSCGVAFAAAGWAYALAPIETFMRAHCDVYLPSVAALAQYVLPE